MSNATHKLVQRWEEDKAIKHNFKGDYELSFDTAKLSGMSAMRFRNDARTYLKNNKDGLKKITKLSALGKGASKCLYPIDAMYGILNGGISATWNTIPNRTMCRLGLYIDNATYQLAGNNVVATGDKIEVHRIMANNALVICRELHVESSTHVAHSLCVVADKVVIKGSMMVDNLTIIARHVEFQLDGGKNVVPCNHYHIITPWYHLADKLSGFEAGLYGLNTIIDTPAWDLLGGLLRHAYGKSDLPNSAQAWTPMLDMNPRKFYQVTTKWNKLYLHDDIKSIKSCKAYDVIIPAGVAVRTDVSDEVSNAPVDVPAEPNDLIEGDIYPRIERFSNAVLQNIIAGRLPDFDTASMIKKELIATIRTIHAMKSLTESELVYAEHIRGRDIQNPDGIIIETVIPSQVDNEVPLHDEPAVTTA